MQESVDDDVIAVVEQLLQNTERFFLSKLPPTTSSKADISDVASKLIPLTDNRSSSNSPLGLVIADSPASSTSSALGNVEAPDAINDPSRSDKAVSGSKNPEFTKAIYVKPSESASNLPTNNQSLSTANNGKSNDTTNGASNGRSVPKKTTKTAVQRKSKTSFTPSENNGVQRPTSNLPGSSSSLCKIMPKTSFKMQRNLLPKPQTPTIHVRQPSAVNSTPLMLANFSAATTNTTSSLIGSPANTSSITTTTPSECSASPSLNAKPKLQQVRTFHPILPATKISPKETVPKPSPQKVLSPGEKGVKELVADMDRSSTIDSVMNHVIKGATSTSFDDLQKSTDSSRMLPIIKKKRALPKNPRNTNKKFMASDNKGISGQNNVGGNFLASNLTFSNQMAPGNLMSLPGSMQQYIIQSSTSSQQNSGNDGLIPLMPQQQVFFGQQTFGDGSKKNGMQFVQLANPRPSTSATSLAPNTIQGSATIQGTSVLPGSSNHSTGNLVPTQMLVRLGTASANNGIFMAGNQGPQFIQSNGNLIQTSSTPTNFSQPSNYQRPSQQQFGQKFIQPKTPANSSNTSSSSVSIAPNTTSRTILPNTRCTTTSSSSSTSTLNPVTVGQTARMSTMTSSTSTFKNNSQPHIYYLPQTGGEGYVTNYATNNALNVANNNARIVQLTPTSYMTVPSGTNGNYAMLAANQQFYANQTAATQFSGARNGNLFPPQFPLTAENNGNGNYMSTFPSIAGTTQKEQKICRKRKIAEQNAENESDANFMPPSLDCAFENFSSIDSVTSTSSNKDEVVEEEENEPPPLLLQDEEIGVHGSFLKEAANMRQQFYNSNGTKRIHSTIKHIIGDFLIEEDDEPFPCENSELMCLGENDFSVEPKASSLFAEDGDASVCQTVEDEMNHEQSKNDSISDSTEKESDLNDESREDGEKNSDEQNTEKEKPSKKPGRRRKKKRLDGMKIDEKSPRKLGKRKLVKRGRKPGGSREISGLLQMDFGPGKTPFQTTSIEAYTEEVMVEAQQQQRCLAFDDRLVKRPSETSSVTSGRTPPPGNSKKQSSVDRSTKSSSKRASKDRSELGDSSFSSPIAVPALHPAPRDASHLSDRSADDDDEEACRFCRGKFSELKRRDISKPQYCSKECWKKFQEARYKVPQKPQQEDKSHQSPSGISENLIKTPTVLPTVLPKLLPSTTSPTSSSTISLLSSHRSISSPTSSAFYIKKRTPQKTPTSESPLSNLSNVHQIMTQNAQSRQSWSTPSLDPSIAIAMSPQYVTQQQPPGVVSFIPNSPLAAISAAGAGNMTNFSQQQAAHLYALQQSQQRLQQQQFLQLHHQQQMQQRASPSTSILPSTSGTQQPLMMYGHSASSPLTFPAVPQSSFEVQRPSSNVGLGGISSPPAAPGTPHSTTSTPSLVQNGERNAELDRLHAKGIPNWTTVDVSRWASIVTNSEANGDRFMNNEIDGAALPLLNTSIMQTNLGLKLGPAVKLNNALDALGVRQGDGGISSKYSQNVTLRSLVSRGIHNWTAEEVGQWANIVTDSNINGDKFVQQEIDGSSLTLLKSQQFQDDLDFKLGPSLKLNLALNILQAG